MLTSNKRYSISYSSRKQAEYVALKRKNSKRIDWSIIDNYAYNSIAEKLAKQAQGGITTAQSLLELDTLISGSDAAVLIRTKQALKTNLETMIDLGIKHTISDYLYQLPKVRKVLDTKQVSFSSWEGTLTDFVTKNSDTAEFNKKGRDGNSFDDLTKKEKDAIQRADNELARIAFSLDELEERGLLKDTATRNRRLARMSYEERYRFLLILKDIDNFQQRAAASKSKFIKDTYLDRRQAVLAGDIGKVYNATLKKQIAAFIAEESRYLSSITGKEERVATLTEKIANKLKAFNKKKYNQSKAEADAQLPSYIARAETIVATETSVAYNFGKLIGFSGPEDLEKEFTWNADWEIQFRDPSGNYQVCEYCRLMDGRKFTVRQLLTIGLQADRGAGGFKGTSRTKTSFKNPAMPMIPGHPNCSCYFSLSYDDRKFDSELLYEDISPEYLEYIDSLDIGARSTVQAPTGSRIRNDLLMQLLGTGLVVGGAFLLARNNAFQSFASALFNKPLIVQYKPAEKLVSDVLEYGSGVFDDDVMGVLQDTVVDAVQSVPTPSKVISSRPLVPK